MAEPYKVGDRIAGRFRVERVLGTGGMGAVFAAEDDTLARRVAIKVMLDEDASDPFAAERFRREARWAVQLQSTNAARVFDFGRATNGKPFIVMEYLEGEDLQEHVKRSGPLPPHVAIDYVRQACDALGEAHRLGLIHRDVKLKNLFLTTKPDGSPLVKVLDFGIAKRTKDGFADLALTTTNTLMGSPAYMAPEQMCASERVDTRADLWSIGVCLYELLTGHLPFEATTLAEVCAKVLKDTVPPITTWTPGVPEELQGVVARCLEKEPDARYQTVEELDAALVEALAACDGAERASTVPIPRPKNEKERLAALERYRVLDTPPEEDFDFLCDVAAALCDAPYAFISFVDAGRVWYKAWHGIQASSYEMPRDDDYCSWAILEPAILQVPDLSRDERMAKMTNTVTEPPLRMYCGANLVTPDGLALGTLCVLDTRPRELSEHQHDLLKKLARQVMALVELRAKTSELQAAVAAMRKLADSVL